LNIIFQIYTIRIFNVKHWNWMYVTNSFILYLLKNMQKEEKKQLSGALFSVPNVCISLLTVFSIKKKKSIEWILAVKSTFFVSNCINRYFSNYKLCILQKQSRYRYFFFLSFSRTKTTEVQNKTKNHLLVSD
jgi:hypothetical protein